VYHNFTVRYTINKNLFLLIFGIIAFSACRKASTVLPTNEKTFIEPEITLFTISNVLQSNMVIQRDKPWQIWGTATTGHKINVKISWNSSTFSVVAGNDNAWKISIPAATATGTPQTITCDVDGSAPVVFTNILIGDVWLCSGQSNMVMPLDAIAPFVGVLNYKSEIAAANYPNIRALTVKEDYKTLPIDNLSNTTAWITCSPQTAGALSGVAYYFARKLQTDINVPIGIIIAASNSSWCVSWMGADIFLEHPELKKYTNGNNAYQLYNGMINPLKNLSIKGFIWYQGENDQTIFPVADYTKLNSALISGWRTAFNQPGLPFYLVQTPFADDYNNTTPKGGDPTLDWLGYFREAQANVLSTPNTGMAVTMDVGEAANHHPSDKKAVGERLALLALKNTYGQNAICDGPKYASYTVNGNTATINFLGNTASGLKTIDGQPLHQLFFVAGADMIFKRGTAAISGNTIIVTAPTDLTTPIQSVRYAFTNAAVTNIQNGAGLPMEPFRTDNW
jgi:sialate O-acetylesterase